MPTLRIDPGFRALLPALEPSLERSNRHEPTVERVVSTKDARPSQAEADYEAIHEMFILVDRLRDLTEAIQDRNAVLGRVATRLSLVWCELMEAALLVES